jgi:hypothetical protein
MNNVRLHGLILSGSELREIHGYKCYTTTIGVRRLSGIVDEIPLVLDSPLDVGQTVTIWGEYRSRNDIVDGRSRLILEVYVNTTSDEGLTDPNTIELEGYCCKPPMYRQTPLHKEITDLLVAVPCGNYRSDFIPCVTWGSNARYANELAVGKYVHIWGRIQSREYEKLLPSGITQTRIAYEVSVNKIMEVKNG